MLRHASRTVRHVSRDGGTESNVGWIVMAEARL